ncbi:MAG: 1,6-anhydro-N-acetylmuramyl-L-alanine amidase AmpD [Methylococcaceae bacterium]|nr:1,6-anhydro-N-acetylmuramyl-L-alanine amidase AmpD [Methylococcaceae bacterium]MCI0732790.1 1,6-anhydro-N-acetylmuramyl-L-alanine amidase AmpD [Methylococcaceae bacterium]
MIRFKIENHWLESARKVPSENCDDRPAGTDISLIVIHCISLPPGEFGGEAIDQLFQNRLNPGRHPYFASIYQLKVSAHILIRRSGEITQYVPFDRRAWHAGKSCYEGRSNCNDFSIGIELEGTDDSRFTDSQYSRSGSLIVSLIDHYPALSRSRIAGHSDIAPGRKTDPGIHFDWKRLFRLIN